MRQALLNEVFGILKGICTVIMGIFTIYQIFTGGNSFVHFLLYLYKKHIHRNIRWMCTFFVLSISQSCTQSLAGI